MLQQVKDYFLKEARAGLAVMVLVFLPLIAIAMFVFHHLPVVPPGAPLKIPPALINLLSKPLPAAINLPPDPQRGRPHAFRRDPAAVREHRDRSRHAARTTRFPQGGPVTGGHARTRGLSREL
jgi:hypothetical protein